MCNVKEETIDHLVSSCSKIAQTDYKERHDKVASMLHWNLCRKYNITTAQNIPDITVDERVWIIDVAIPGDGRIEEKELEKISKYQDLKTEIERLWEKKPL